MNERYNVYFAGQIIKGHDLESVRKKIGAAFKADQTTLDKLFSGKLQLIKRDCDHTTAFKYKDAMEQAGALPVIKRCEAENAAESGSDSRESAAQKIAKLAAAPDEMRFRQQTEADTPSPTPTLQIHSTAEQDGIGLAPPGTEVLREEERTRPVTREIDTTGLQVDTTADRLSEEITPPPVTLDTSHLNLANAGETIPNLPSTDAPLSPNLDGLELSPPGTDFSDCATRETPSVTVDLSGLTLESPGAELLEERYRKSVQDSAPATDHLSLAD